MTQNKKRRIKASDLYRFCLIRAFELAPDGRRMVYALQRVDRKTEKKYSNLWMVNRETSAARQFTVGDQVDRSPRWSPDGTQIAFLSNREGEKQSQIYLIPADGGEAKALTDLKGEFGGFSWSPDGASLVFRFRKKDKDVLKRESDPRKKELGRVYRHIDRVRYSLDGAGYNPKERWHIWTVGLEDGHAQQLTCGPIHDEGMPAWSPDGKHLVFASNRTLTPDLDPDCVDLYVMPSSGGTLRKLDAPLGGKSLPSFSPDGKWIAYIGREGRSDWWKNNALWIVPSDGEGTALNLSSDYDFTLSTFTLNDMGDAQAMPPTWSLDGKKIYFQISRHGSTTVQSLSIAEGSLEVLVGPPGVVGAYNFDAQQRSLAYFHGSMVDPGQIWIREMDSQATRQLTTVNEKLLAKLDLGSVEEVWFKGADGNDLQGWIMKPPDFDPQRAYPSILEIHGGPLGQYGNFFMHEFYYLAAHDHVVYFCNPRGGIGYGETHAKAIWGAWGTVDYADLMKWADYVQEKPYVAEDRMFVTGGSYGGYMTAWIIGHTQRFRAAVAQRSVTNLISMWGSSDANWVFQEPFGGKPPYESIDQLWESSPIKHIATAKTPTLVIHSEKDLRCPLEQGQQLFVALKTLGVDSEFVVFPDEPHGLSRVGRTDRRIARLRHILGWFERYLPE